MNRGFLQLLNYKTPYNVQAYRLRGIVHGGVRLTKVLTGVTLQPYTQRCALLLKFIIIKNREINIITINEENIDVI